MSFEIRAHLCGHVGLAVFSLSLGGCNAIFGIQEGQPAATSSTTQGAGGDTSSTGGDTSSAGGTGGTSSAGGAGGTGGTSSAGGAGGTGGAPTGSGGTGGGGAGLPCGVYDGSGSIDWTDLGGANLPTTTLGTNGSVGAHYHSDDEATYISLGSSLDGYCSSGGGITLSGKPIANQVYTLVDKATAKDFIAFHQAKNAYVETGARPPWPGYDVMTGCGAPEEKFHWFGSTPGVGMVQVISVDVAGFKMAFKATGVVATPILEPEYDGTGSIGVEIDGVSDCYYEEN